MRERNQVREKLEDLDSSLSVNRFWGALVPLICMRFLLLLLFFTNIFASTLHLSTPTNPARLNPLLATDSSSSEIAGFIFNSLVKYDKDAKEIVGDLAKKFYFEDEKTLVFELRSGVKWHDGKSFSSKDVLFTYNTIISPTVSTPYSAAFRFVSSIEIVDDLVLKVHYTEPYFKAVEIWTMGILPEHLLRDEQNLMSSKFNTSPIGTGAYKLKKLEFSKNIELEAYDEYFEGKPKIDRISFSVVGDAMTRFLKLKAGEVDVGSLEPLQYSRQLDESFFKRFKTHENISYSYSYLGFNLRLEKFQDPRVREALSLAIDREELVKVLFFDHAKVCLGPFLPNSMAYDESLKPVVRDLKRAKELLSEAGYSKQNPFEFEIATSNSNSIRPYAAQMLQQQLLEVGVRVKLRIMEWQAFLNTVVFPHKFDSVLLGWSLSPLPDPYLFWHSSSDKAGGFNLVGYKNNLVDELIERSQSEVDEERLGELFRRIGEIVINDNAYLFLYIPTSISAVDKRIKGIDPSQSGIWHNYIKWEKME